MIPIGYMQKRVAVQPLGSGAPQVEDVYSVSNRPVEPFADHVQFWRHNGYWLFDSPRAMRALAAEHSIPLDG